MIVQLHHPITDPGGVETIRSAIISARAGAIAFERDERAIALVIKLGERATEPGGSVAIECLHPVALGFGGDPEMAFGRMVIDAHHLATGNDGIGRSGDDGAMIRLHGPSPLALASRAGKAGDA